MVISLQIVWSTLRSSSVFMWKVVSDIHTSLVKVWATTNQLLASLCHGMKFTGLIPALGSIIGHHVQLIVAKTGKYRTSLPVTAQYMFSGKTHLPVGLHCPAELVLLPIAGVRGNGQMTELVRLFYKLDWTAGAESKNI